MGVLVIIRTPCTKSPLEALHQFDVLDEVWFIRDDTDQTLLSVPAHCKRARCFDMPQGIADFAGFLRGLFAMHKSCKPPTMATMLLGGWLDLDNTTIYSLGARGTMMPGIIALDANADDDPLNVSDFSTSSSSDTE